MRNDLPETCFATMPGMGDLIIIKRGEAGYYPSVWETGNEVENQKIADINNQKRGITPAQVKAMLVGSMFGFDVPGANPQVYFDEARFVSSSVLGVGAAIKDPVSSCYSPIKGNLFLYQVSGKDCLYLDVSSLPESLMGKRSGNIIFLDMVGGSPLVPVTDPNSNHTLSLELGSYRHGTEKNAGYEIIAKVQVGPVEYALGEHGGKFTDFVTWRRTPAHDGDGPPNYYWGHYFDNREKAVNDFCKRAVEQYKMLYPGRRPSITEQLDEQAVLGSKSAAKAKKEHER